MYKINISISFDDDFVRNSSHQFKTKEKNKLTHMCLASYFFYYSVYEIKNSCYLLFVLTI